MYSDCAVGGASLPRLRRHGKQDGLRHAHKIPGTAPAHNCAYEEAAWCPGLPAAFGFDFRLDYFRSAMASRRRRRTTPRAAMAVETSISNIEPPSDNCSTTERVAMFDWVALKLSVTDTV